MTNGARGVHGLSGMGRGPIGEKPRITRALLARIASYLRPYRLRLAVSTAIILAAAVLDVFPALLTGRIIDEGFLGGDFPLLARLVAAAVGVLLLSSLLGLLENYLNVWVSQHIMNDMKNQMYAHLQKMSQRFYTVNKQGDIITRMTSDVSGVQSALSSILTGTVSNVAVLIACIVVMLQKNAVLAIVGTLILPLFILPTRRVGRKRWSITAQSQKAGDEANQILNETLSVSGQQLVKLFTNEELERERFRAANAEIMRLKIRESMVGRWFRMAIATFTNMAPMLIYLVGGVLILRVGTPGLTVGDITVMVALLARMYRPISVLLGVQVEFYQAMALFTRLFEYMDMPVEIENRPDALRPAAISGELRFEHVGFHYTPDTPVLRDVSFRIPAGSMTAIVGPSGAGKSTITSLVTRMYDVVDGAVRLDGHDLRDLDLPFLRAQVGVVTQDCYLFNGTIRENLLYARAGATDDELARACAEANILDFIGALPDGMDTVVGNRGIRLSGGEKQRVSIARVILKDPRVLIFDEATSSLDSISEQQIQRAIAPLLKTRTSLVIAHRLSTITAADQIVVLAQGAVAEVGDHRSLLQRGGVYSKLYRTQFQGEEELPGGVS